MMTRNDVTKALVILRARIEELETRARALTPRWQPTGPDPVAVLCVSILQQEADRCAAEAETYTAEADALKRVIINLTGQFTPPQHPRRQHPRQQSRQTVS